MRSRQEIRQALKVSGIVGLCVTAGLALLLTVQCLLVGKSGHQAGRDARADLGGQAQGVRGVLARFFEETTPPESVKTFSDFMAWRPHTNHFVTSHLDRRKFVRALGVAGLFWSTYPEYVFDESGKMVDWTWDSSDDGEFLDRWPWVAATQITLEEAQAICRK